MSFVQVIAGLRDTLCGILNHSFSPHLASTGIHCLVGEVPLAMRNHVFVAATFGGREADEYHEFNETGAHWTNIEILRNHCKVYGLVQEGAKKELQERIQRSWTNQLVTADVNWRIPANEETASNTFAEGRPDLTLSLRALNDKIIELDATARSVLHGQEGPQLRGAQAKAHKQLARTKLAQLEELNDYEGDLDGKPITVSYNIGGTSVESTLPQLGIRSRHSFVICFWIRQVSPFLHSIR